jgi:hypothetical protein
MSALFEFVVARVAEDEAVAHAAATTPMREFDTARPTMRHIVRWDPARVRVECRAKRNLAEWADAGGNVFVLCQLAAPYEDHPDWCEDWRYGPTADYGDS